MYKKPANAELVAVCFFSKEGVELKSFDNYSRTKKNSK